MGAHMTQMLHNKDLIHMDIANSNLFFSTQSNVSIKDQAGMKKVVKK